MSYNHYLLATAYQTNRAVTADISKSGLEQVDLSDMNLNNIITTLTELNAVIAGQLDYLDWGTNLFYVSSEASISRYGKFDEVERTQVATIELRDYLIELKNFKEQCEIGDYYKTIIGQAFTTIKINPSQYKRWATSDLYYLITLSNITVTLVLETNDFNLTEVQYVAQLKRDF